MPIHKICKAVQARRDELDANVKFWNDLGVEPKDIAQELGVSIQAVSFSLKRLRDGYSMERHSSEQAAEEEAKRLIELKLAPTFKPKAKKIMVNGWENGHYVHYEAYDVSEFWGLS